MSFVRRSVSTHASVSSTATAWRTRRRTSSGSHPSTQARTRARSASAKSGAARSGRATFVAGLRRLGGVDLHHHDRVVVRVQREKLLHPLARALVAHAEPAAALRVGHGVAVGGVEVVLRDEEADLVALDAELSPPARCGARRGWRAPRR